MRKKLIGPTLAAMLFALCSPAQAQQPKKVPRIGYLSEVERSYLTPPVPRQFGWLCASVAT